MITEAFAAPLRAFLFGFSLMYVAEDWLWSDVSFAFAACSDDMVRRGLRAEYDRRIPV
jgi:hypothetical protein